MATITPKELEQDSAITDVETPAFNGMKVPRNLKLILISILIGIIAVVFLSKADESDKADAKKKQEETQEASKKNIETPANLTGFNATIDEQKAAADKQVKDQAAAQQQATLGAPTPAPFPGGANLPPLPPKSGSSGGYVPPANNQAMDGESLKYKEKLASAEVLVIAEQNGGNSAQQDPYVAQLQRLQDDNDARMRAAREAGDRSTKQAFDQIEAMTRGGAGGQQDNAPVSAADANTRWLSGQSSQANTPIKAIAPPGGYTLVRGTVVPAVTLMDITSDIVGDFTAMVSQDVYDSQRHLLIPRGSKLFGSYNSGVKIGQAKIMVAFTWLYLPSGAQIPLNGMQGADAMGGSGLPGDVDNHFFKMFGSALAIGVVDRLVNGKTSGVQAYGNTATSTGGMSQILVNTANTILQRNQNIPPSVNVPSGSRFNMIVKQDIFVDPAFTGRN